jgi:hypothetical protein
MTQRRLDAKRANLNLACTEFLCVFYMCLYVNVGKDTFDRDNEHQIIKANN